MTQFDFIVADDFRQSLERDYEELRTALQWEGWKSVQVLAGSIVEAVLVDYLVATPNASRSKKDPLRMDLSEVIAVCVAEKVISQRTSELCSVIRSYRNLIHPGRAVRLEEEPPSGSSAEVAVAIIDLIVADVVRIRQKQFGLTAIQIASKVERDRNSLPILRHLLEDVHPSERDKLVVEVLPKRILEYGPVEAGSPAAAALDRLRQAYGIAKKAASGDALNRAAAQYVRILKEGDGSLVTLYDETFFEAGDLEFVGVAQRPLVKQHILSGLGIIDSFDKLDRIKGIEEYLEPDDVDAWLPPLLRVLISRKLSAELKARVRNYLLTAHLVTKSDVDVEIDTRLEAWSELMRAEGREPEADELNNVRDALSHPF